MRKNPEDDENEAKVDLGFSSFIEDSNLESRIEDKHHGDVLLQLITLIFPLNLRLGVFSSGREVCLQILSHTALD